MRRILATWIGQADYRAMLGTLAAAEREEFQKKVKPGPPQRDNLGPIRTLLQFESFDEIHLLSNDDPALAQRFQHWLGDKVRLHLVEVANPTDYARLFTVADETLRAIMASRLPTSARLSIHLSPGTPAMTAVWVLLGKTRYPATFYQSVEGKAWLTEVPFDLTVEFVPELMQRPDIHLQHLAARSPQEVSGFEQITGDSAAIRLAVGRARRAALHDVPVLILGESGTGKERFAHAIHAASHRGQKGRPFLALNCAALPRELLEAELFGHTKNAFTGAAKERAGLFESSDGGTLFLDEVGECDLMLQAKLLRVLQPPPGAGPCVRVFQRLGESQERRADVRIIAATNRNLQSALARGVFREDLYYRLAVISIKLPALRERRNDIPVVGAALLEQINRDLGQQAPGYLTRKLSPGAVAFLKKHDWPGNIRQLYNVLLQASVMSAGETLERIDLEAALAEMPGGPSGAVLDEPLGEDFNLDAHLERIQRHYLDRAMRESAGVKAKAARLLGYANYQKLDAQLKRLGVRWRQE